MVAKTFTVHMCNYDSHQQALNALTDMVDEWIVDNIDEYYVVAIVHTPICAAYGGRTTSLNATIYYR